MIKKKVSLIIIFVMLLSILNISYGATETKLKLTSDKEEVNAGETVTLTLSVDKMGVEGGIFALQGNIEYDQNIFESMSFQSDIFSKPQYNANTDENTPDFITSGGNTTIQNGASVSTGATAGDNLFKIILKVKSSAETQETTFKMNHLVSVDNEDNKINVPEVTYTFKIKGTTQDDPTPTTTPTINTTINTTTNTSTSGSSTQKATSGSDTTTSGKSLPSAGKVAIGTLGVIGIIMVIFFGMGYRKYNKMTK